MAKIYSWKIGTCQQGEVALFMPQLFNQFTQIWVKMVHVKTKIINSTLLNVVISHEVILDPVLVFKSKSIMSVTALTADSLIHCSTKHRLCDIIVYGRCLVVSNCALFSQGCTAVRFLTWQQGWQRWAPLTLFSHHTFGPWLHQSVQVCVQGKDSYQSPLESHAHSTLWDWLSMAYSFSLPTMVHCCLRDVCFQPNKTWKTTSPQICVNDFMQGNPGFKVVIIIRKKKERKKTITKT